MKNTGMILLALVLVLALVGCQSKDYDNYLEAVERTDQVQSGVREMEIGYGLQVDEAKMEGVDIELFKAMNNIELTLTETFDKEAGRTKFDIFTVFGGIGIDSQVVASSDRVTVEIPLLGKYVYLNPKELSMDEEVLSGAVVYQLDEDTLKSIDKAYRESFGEEDVFRGENTVMDTPDGLVKATKYEVRISDPALRKFAKEALSALGQDENIDAYLSSNETPLKKEELMSAIEKVIDTTKLMEFEIIHYLDHDGYVIDRRLSLVASLENEESFITGFRFDMHMTLGKIGDAVSIEFPDVDEKDMIPLENLEEELPKLLESFDKE
ncbi:MULTISPECIES: hypothetical protein [unclassified Fusibacter]|uniref:hypothetical protein n=1 Tax=unclassified Fusibacter TaxID=2624464 RepID=UPI001011952C|nr:MULTISPECIES: hypothetical protein [unclassified Fusibacter]MCK8059793.1 hypothetical protein [Fusibacter sp. A2]NPE21594.1 hypothetical protein [Fusibacter sp. A1]RXV62001.1 hypothetical protein DWB64_07110 [Fusibacter sp. A1]